MIKIKWKQIKTKSSLIKWIALLLEEYHQPVYLNQTNHSIAVLPIPLEDPQCVRFAVTFFAFRAENRPSYREQSQLNLVVLMYLIVHANHYHMYRFVMMMIHVRWKRIFQIVQFSMRLSLHLHVRLIDVPVFVFVTILNLRLFHQLCLDALMQPVLGWAFVFLEKPNWKWLQT